MQTSTDTTQSSTALVEDTVSAAATNSTQPAPTFNEIITTAHSRAEELCKYLFPDGRRKGHGWFVKSYGGSGEPLNITVVGKKAGLWEGGCFGTGEGTNLIEVWSHARKVTMDDAAAAVATWLDEHPLPSRNKKGAAKQPAEGSLSSPPQFLSIEISDTPNATETPAAPIESDSKYDIRLVKIADIRVDSGIQTRTSINSNTIKDYAEKLSEGVKFPPIVLFTHGGEYLLADGFHRYGAAQKLKLLEILAEVRPGNRRDALRYALGANTDNGLQRTNADKRRCVEIALREYVDSSDGVIGKMCGVSHTFVGNRRRELATVASSTGSATKHAPDHSTPETRIGLDGKTRKTRRPRATGSTIDPGDRNTASENVLPQPPANPTSAEFNERQVEAFTLDNGTTQKATVCYQNTELFTLIDGTQVEVCSGYFQSNWLGEPLKEMEKSTGSLSDGEKEAVASKQRLLFGLTSALNVYTGSSPSREVMKGAHETMVILADITQAVSEAWGDPPTSRG